MIQEPIWRKKRDRYGTNNLTISYLPLDLRNHPLTSASYIEIVPSLSSMFMMAYFASLCKIYIDDAIRYFQATGLDTKDKGDIKD